MGQPRDSVLSPLPGCMCCLREQGPKAFDVLLKTRLAGAEKNPRLLAVLAALVWVRELTDSVDGWISHGHEVDYLELRLVPKKRILRSTCSSFLLVTVTFFLLLLLLWLRSVLQYQVEYEWFLYLRQTFSSSNLKSVVP